jgi:hypothetical protein
MINKFKTSFNEIKHDRFVQGMVFGSVVGTVTCLVTLKSLGVCFHDVRETMHIPESIVEEILSTGLPVLVNRPDGVQLAVGPS